MEQFTRQRIYLKENKEEAAMKTSLLIGNGFNRIGTDKAISWEELIKVPLRQYGLLDVPDGFVDIVNMSYPLKFEYIINFIQERTGGQGGKIYLEAKNLILNELNQGLSQNDWRKKGELKPLIQRIHPDAILTTNYDTMLEDIFYSRSGRYKYPQALINKISNAKSMNSLVYLKKTTTLGGVNYYHVHGIKDVPASICLGYEHYTRILSRLRTKIAGTEGCEPPILKYLGSLEAGEEKPKYLANEYQTRFFDSNMYIIGLTLEEQEIDIWWLLCYRAYLYFSNIHGGREKIKNKIVYYDIHKRHLTNDGYTFEDDYQKQKAALFGSTPIPNPH